MKSKFQNFDFGSVEVLSRDEQNKVKGGAYGFGQYGGSGGGFPTGTNPPGPGGKCFKTWTGQYFADAMRCKATQGSDCIGIDSCPDAPNLL
jgi:hypothetical protein